MKITGLPQGSPAFEREKQMGITAELAEDLSKIAALTENDTAQLSKLIVDFFAASFAGYKQNRHFNDAVEKTVFPTGGAKESSVLLHAEKLPAGKAAFMNAVYGHGAELDDGNKKAAGHAGVHLIPAVFALAEKLGSTNNDVLLALATGYEAYIRISSAAQPGLVKRGYHSTGAAGTLACAAACARLYHLDAQGIEDAIALSTTMTGGLLSYGDSRPAIKPLNPAKAAENGVFAASLAAAGVKGPSEALEGPNGWFHAFTEAYHEECLRGADHLLLHDCYFKLYPSCRHTHCGIDAAVSLHSRVRPEEIESVRVFIYPNAIKLAGIRIPKDADDTKFSIHYTLAQALLRGAYGIDYMDPKAAPEAVWDLIAKTELIADETMEDRKAGIRGAKAEVVKKDGTVLSETVTVPRGDPENPVTEEEILTKLRICAAGLADDAALTKLVDAVKAVRGDGLFRYPAADLL